MRKDSLIQVPLGIPPIQIDRETAFSSALGKLRDICGNCPGLARLALPCGGTPAAIPYIHLRSSDGKAARKDVRKDVSRKDVRKDIF